MDYRDERDALRSKADGLERELAERKRHDERADRSAEALREISAMRDRLVVLERELGATPVVAPRGGRMTLLVVGIGMAIGATNNGWIPFFSVKGAFVYISFGGSLRGYDAATGEERWRAH